MVIIYKSVCSQFFEKQHQHSTKSAQSEDPRGDIQWPNEVRVMNMTDRPTLNVNKQQNGRGQLK